MESDFATVVGRWQSFQSLAGSVAATLLGLLFVAVSIRPAIFGRRDHPDFLSIAAKSMGLFILVIAIALVFQIPDLHRDGMGIALAIMAGISVLNTIHQFTVFQRIFREWGPFFLARRILLPAVGHALLLAVSIALLVGDEGWLPVLGFTQILYILTATYNAWDLLIRAGEC
jgi:hypothetical protein